MTDEQMKINGYEIKPFAYLKGANLVGANLVGANLEDANLECANLKDAYLECANLKYANLVNADLEGAYLWGADLRRAILDGANVKGTILEKKGEPQLAGQADNQPTTTKEFIMTNNNNNNNHPTTPPPGLVTKDMVSQWRTGVLLGDEATIELVAQRAASWGWQQRDASVTDELQKARDEELEACVEWVVKTIPSWAPHTFGEQLRAARRPKPKSLAEEALEELQELADFSAIDSMYSHQTEKIRRALERLQELDG